MSIESVTLDKPRIVWRVLVARKTSGSTEDDIVWLNDAVCDGDAPKLKDCEFDEVNDPDWVADNDWLNDCVTLDEIAWLGESEGLKDCD